MKVVFDSDSAVRIDSNRPVQHTPRFLADRMLGRVTRYLRFAGFDSVFTMNRPELIDRAVSEGRILLTRDRSVAAHCRRVENLEWFCPETNDSAEQFILIYRRYELWRYRELKHRCMKCNGQLQGISPEQATEIVPAYIAGSVDGFMRCGNCGRIVWKGSHWRAMQIRMNQWVDRAHQTPR
ncbi:Mut7-C RNAse domain-containing protein [bacterium]|nr:Mut7-C RNAse domain-containing protein [candidate division CSSED10-310 bacterium]